MDKGNGSAYNTCIYECVFKFGVTVQQLLVEEGSVGGRMKEGEMHNVRSGQMFQLDTLKKGHDWSSTRTDSVPASLPSRRQSHSVALHKVPVLF
jgi:hypothetical protein